MDRSAVSLDPGAARPVRGFGPGRRLWEKLQGLLTPGDWPAALVERLGASPVVALREHAEPPARGARPGPQLRIGFGSDFHAGPTTSERILDAATEALIRAAPDVLLLGGDFVSINARYVNRITERLGTIVAPAGRFAVLGNHDHWAGSRTVIAALERAGIEVLDNSNRRLPPPFESVSICGIDDHLTGYPDAARAFAGAGPVRLLLMHAPSGLLDVAGHAFSIAFSGHTHGGQIALPNGYPLYVPGGPLSRQYCAGRFDLASGGALLVSRGVGSSTVPFRWNSPPEVHLWRLDVPAP
ncbi:MAG: metallophosphoesterase [Gemmatimonadales bacterium]